VGFPPAKHLRNGAAATLAAAFVLTVAPAFADKPATVLDAAKPVKITAISIDFDRDNPDRKDFGKLVWRGGLNLFADSSYFGGFSALAIDPSGKTLLAVSDAGIWLRATVDYDGRKMRGLSNAVIGPLLGNDGKALRDDQERDSEGMTLIDGGPAGGTAYIAFERHHRIIRYPFSTLKFGPPAGSLALPPGTKRMRPNSGLEAIALLRSGPLKGTVVAFSENLTDANGNLQGWLIGGPAPGPFSLKRLAGFDVTDVALLPDGGLVVLERRFRYSEGIKMRIRRIKASEIKRGALIVGETLLEATDALNIDNMEGIAVHRSAAGETILTLISDENYSPLQRTLLMQFALPDEKPVLAAPAAH
jgi:hypothetical protein